MEEKKKVGKPRKDESQIEPEVDNTSSTMPEQPVKYKELFVPKRDVAKYEEIGYKISELKSDSGFSISAGERGLFLNDTKIGRLIYMTKGAKDESQKESI